MLPLDVAPTGRCISCHWPTRGAVPRLFESLLDEGEGPLNMSRRCCFRGLNVERDMLPSILSRTYVTQHYFVSEARFLKTICSACFG